MVDRNNKFDLAGIISSVKAIISPEGNTPNTDPDDAIGVKIAQLSTMVQQLATAHAEQAKELTRVNKLLNGLFKDIDMLRNPPSDGKPTAAHQATQPQQESAAPCTHFNIDSECKHHHYK